MVEGILKIKNYENISIQETTRKNQIAKDRNKNEQAAESVKTEDIKKDQNQDMQGAIDRIVNAAKYFNRKIELKVENDLGITVVQVIDKDTGKVVRQIPPEDLVELSRRAKDLKGLLVSKEG